VVARRAVPPDLRAVVLRAVVVLRLAVDALREPDGFRVVREPEPLAPETAFSAALRALFNHEALPLRMFAGSFLSSFSMLLRVTP
jgi:hypothetical protein